MLDGPDATVGRGARRSGGHRPVTPTQRFAGKIALVTGAARPPGLGRATALRLAAEGADVVCVDAPPGGDAGLDSDAVAPGALDRLVETIEAGGRRAFAVEADLGAAGQAEAVVNEAVERFGRLDVCCHLGGGTGPRLATGPLLDIGEAAWDRCVAANLTAPWLTTRACAAAMTEQGDGGAITLLSSFAVRNTPERYGAFAAARAELGHLVEVLAAELGPAGIRVNAVLPLGVAPDTATNPGLDDLLSRTNDDAATWVRRQIPLGRLQSPDETAAVFAFLSSDDASFVSGQALSVSGGAVR
jgi:NAD(P)-dependent dehydrogenase (short-subunit alcohol dehydrogenase family)